MYVLLPAYASVCCLPLLRCRIDCCGWAGFARILIWICYLFAASGLLVLACVCGFSVCWWLLMPVIAECFVGYHFLFDGWVFVLFIVVEDFFRSL